MPFASRPKSLGVRSFLTRLSIGPIVFVGLFVRIVVLLIHHAVMPLPQSADAVGYERTAWELCRAGRGEFSKYLFSGSDFISFLGSFVYELTGRAPWVLGLLMVLLGTALIPLLYRTSLELWGDRGIARLTALACALFPQLVLHSALFLRETPVAFCLAAASLGAIRFLKRNSLPSLGAFLFWVLLGSLFHSGVIFAVPGLLMGILLVRGTESRTRISRYVVNLAAAMILVGVFYLVNETGFGLDKLGGSFDEALVTFEAHEALGIKGGAAFPEWMRVREGVLDWWKVPVRYVTFLFSPLLPFLVRSPHHLLGVVDAALYLLLFWVLVRNWKTISHNPPAAVLLIVLLLLYLVFSLGAANFGTAIRHRAKMAPLLLLLAAGLPIAHQVHRDRYSNQMEVG